MSIDSEFDCTFNPRIYTYLYLNFLSEVKLQPIGYKVKITDKLFSGLIVLTGCDPRCDAKHKILNLKHPSTTVKNQKFIKAVLNYSCTELDNVVSNF